MHLRIHLSLRDKFLISFLGLAIVLTGMLAMLAGKVSEILPDMSSSQAERFEAQLALRDMREMLFDAEPLPPFGDEAERKQRLTERLQRYETEFSLTSSTGVYEALVSEERSDLIARERDLMDGLWSDLRNYQSALEASPRAAEAHLTSLLQQTKELEHINDDSIDVLVQAQNSTRSYIFAFFLVALALILLGISIFAHLLAMWITNPLRKIQEAAHRISSGDFTLELKPDSHDELGVLMRSFEDMRKKVLLSLSEVQAYAKRDDMLINSIVDIIIAVDESEKIILFNAAAEHVSGWSEIGAIGKSLKDILVFHGLEEPSDERAVISDVIASGKSRSLLKPLYVEGTKNGKQTPVTMSVAPFVEGDGKRGAVIVLRDVSENIELDKLREEFVSIASHQLRTPLTAIRWLLEVLIRGEGEKRIAMDDKHRDTLHQAYSRTLSMSELVSSLLVLSRVDAQKVSAKLAPVNLKDIFEKIQMNVGSAAERRGIKLAFDISLAQPIMSDEVILMQVLINIVSNAIKYSRDGGSVTVTTKVDGAMVRVDVKDSGIGIPEDQQQSIFKKFFRAKNALTHTPEGTGIGLYMVRSFAQLIGGDVTFVSKENEGTTFTVTLPLTQTHG